mmetsp:Transcript_59319/g.153274  ORF Transcript_59319/g.153274 Transcript_59319/m.153274 type:complete len:236 (-) Transcript_59319:563-1270(-)
MARSTQPGCTMCRPRGPSARRLRASAHFPVSRRAATRCVTCALSSPCTAAPSCSHHHAKGWVGATTPTPVNATTQPCSVSLRRAGNTSLTNGTPPSGGYAPMPPLLPLSPPKVPRCRRLRISATAGSCRSEATSSDPAGPIGGCHLAAQPSKETSARASRKGKNKNGETLIKCAVRTFCDHISSRSSTMTTCEVSDGKISSMCFRPGGVLSRVKSRGGLPKSAPCGSMPRTTASA